MENTTLKNIMIGLPETGKTTFLAALWYVVNEGEVSKSLRLKTLPEASDYINKISADWLQCKPIGRTVMGTPKNVAMMLEDPETGTCADINFPDLSGEVFRQQLLTRQWPSDYYDAVQDYSGILVFIHPDKVIESVRIDMANDIMGQEVDPPIAEGLPESPVQWSPEEVSTQVQLVELLQFHLMEMHSQNLNRIGVVISAWDLINEAISPDSWLQKRMPLLHQFLKSNAEVANYRIFGISAQGGKLENTADLLKKGQSKPSERIIVSCTNCTDHDITAPVKWLLER